MYYFVVNEYGRGGEVRPLFNKVRGRAKSLGIGHKAFLTESKGDAERIAERICALEDEDKKILVVGGDGTLNEVINGIPDLSKVPVGVIPLGSANDFTKGLGLTKDPVEAFERIINSKEERHLDLGRVTYGGVSRLFAISSGVGLDALVCKNIEKGNIKKMLNKVGIGGKSYVVTTVGSLFTMKQFNVTAQFTDGTEEVYDRAFYLAAMNLPAEGGGVKMAPGATAADGLLTLSCGHGISFIKAPLSLIKLVTVKHEGAAEFTIKDFPGVKLSMDRPVCLHTDGEYLGEVSEVSYECVPGVLRLIN